MKISIFSDIHGNLYALEEFFKKSKDLEIDLYIFCGDIFGYYYDQEAVISKLKSMENLFSIKGNHDQFFLNVCINLDNEIRLVNKFGNSYKNITKRISNENKDFVESLPDQLVLNFVGKSIAVFHGSPKDPVNGRVYPDTEISESDGFTSYDYVILGHTHYPMVRHIGSTIIINPGSIGQSRARSGCSFATLTIPSGEIEFHEIKWNKELLAKDIEMYDSGNQKLIDILFRNEVSP